MSGITLTQAEAHLSDALSALTKAREATRYKTGGGNEVERDLKQLREEVKYWDSMVKRLSRGGLRIRGGTPCG
jgi:hypothetical protein